MNGLQILLRATSMAVFLGSSVYASESSTAARAPQLADTPLSAASEAPVQLAAGRRWFRSRSGYSSQRRQYSSDPARYQNYPRYYNDFRPYNRLITPSNLYRPYAHAPYYDYFYGP